MHYIWNILITLQMFNEQNRNSPPLHDSCIVNVWKSWPFSPLSGPWLLPPGAVCILYYRRGYFVPGNRQCAARPSYQTGKGTIHNRLICCRLRFLDAYFFIKSNRQAIKSLSPTGRPFLTSLNRDQPKDRRANTLGFMQRKWASLFIKTRKPNGRHAQGSPKAKASRVSGLFLKIRFSLVKSAYVIRFVVVDVVFRSILRNGFALGGEKKSGDANDKNTLGAGMENFQLICTLGKAFVFRWKIRLGLS